jgi:hypothetical protein
MALNLKNPTIRRVISEQRQKTTPQLSTPKATTLRGVSSASVGGSSAVFQSSAGVEKTLRDSNPTSPSVLSYSNFLTLLAPLPMFAAQGVSQLRKQNQLYKSENIATDQTRYITREEADARIKTRSEQIKQQEEAKRQLAEENKRTAVAQAKLRNSIIEERLKKTADDVNITSWESWWNTQSDADMILQQRQFEMLANQSKQIQQLKNLGIDTSSLEASQENLVKDSSLTGQVSSISGDLTKTLLVAGLVVGGIMILQKT